MLPVFIMVCPSLTGLRPAGRDDAYPLVAHRVGHKQQPPFHHTNHTIALFIMVVFGIKPIEREGIPEHLACHLEGNGMVAPVSGGFVIVPFEMLVLHMYGLPV